MRLLVRAHGPVRLGRRRASHLEALARAIVYQQLAGAAARTIWGRTKDVLGGRVTAEAILGADEEQLRGAGLSRNKLAAIRDLALKTSDGSIPLARISRLPDEDIIERLVQVRGIGRWTAEMFLMFQLRRPDVWPVDDLGVRKGYAIAYGLDDLPAPKVLATLGDRFRPYRSIAAWYCYRAVDTVTV
ncbi:MAG: DNA-3-methyladenine glycosylase 2 family protein [Actinobacteria bacterium]|nr:DNA-3-methyladenine glycosylase 2 family protein [Actinomycetota bacterium]